MQQKLGKSLRTSIKKKSAPTIQIPGNDVKGCFGQTGD